MNIVERAAPYYYAKITAPMEVQGTLTLAQAVAAVAALPRQSGPAR